MLLSSLLLFALTEFLLSLSPGPAVFLVLSQAMRLGFKGSVRGVFGIITGELIFFSLSALGLGALLIASQPLFLFIKYVGAAYLVYLGLKMIWESFKRQALTASETSVKAKPYRQGLLMQLSNPKAILFFTALLPQFIDPTAPANPQFVMLGLISITVQGSILLSYAWLAEKGGHWLRESRFSRWLDRFAGSFLIGAGLKLAFAKQH
ncbi:MAG: LysE family translocator [Trueperaceae bacterium]|nr:LysE family translocator [Trueperaceae bacterium]